LLRSLRQDLEKTRRHHDWDALKLAEHQPISIASYKTISASQSRDLQQLIVVGVATNLHGSSQPKSGSWRPAAVWQIADIMRYGQETRGFAAATGG